MFPLFLQRYFDYKEFGDYVNQITQKYFNTNKLVENISNGQIFLDKIKLEELKLNYNEVAEKISMEIIHFPHISKSVTAETLQKTTFSQGVLHLVQNGYNQKLSGDIIFIWNPAVIASLNRKGTTHGTGYSYDTHVPAIFYGCGIRHGSSKIKYEITDISPTVANLLKVEFTNANVGKIIDEVFTTSDCGK